MKGARRRGLKIDKTCAFTGVAVGIANERSLSLTLDGDGGIAAPKNMVP